MESDSGVEYFNKELLVELEETKKNSLEIKHNPQSGLRFEISLLF